MCKNLVSLASEGQSDIKVKTVVGRKGTKHQTKLYGYVKQDDVITGIKKELGVVRGTNFEYNSEAALLIMLIKEIKKLRSDINGSRK